MKKSDIFWQTYLNLEKELIEVSKYVFITDVRTVNKGGRFVEETCNTQLETFSPHIADLLVRCCVQIEAVSKELYYELNGPKPRGDNSIKFDDDCLRLIDIKWETHKKCVLVVAPFFNLTKDEHRILRPLKDAHRSQAQCWEKAYQAVKHDRYTSLSLGNVRALIHAMAALYLLNLYLRKDIRDVKHQDLSLQDYSMGSSLFAVKPPVANQLWYGNQPQLSESPYVVTYREDVYKQIEDIQRKEEQALNEYWISQPETKEPAFLSQLQEAYKKGGRVMQICELAKYRLNKLVPSTLPFDERKERFIHSEAWNCWVNQHNTHLTPEEIKEDNIEREINAAGVRWGMDIMKRYQRLEWLPIAMDSGMCRIYIPEPKITSDKTCDEARGTGIFLDGGTDEHCNTEDNLL